MGGHFTLTNEQSGYLPTATNAFVARERGELWSVATGEVTLASDDTLDIAVHNPDGSDRVVDIIAWSAGLNDSAKVTQYRDSGIYTGTASEITPRNFDGTIDDGGQSFNAEFQSGAGDQLVTVGTTAQFNGGFYTASSQGRSVRATVADRPALSLSVAEGESFALHIEDGGNGSDPIPGLVVAEYPTDREF